MRDANGNRVPEPNLDPPDYEEPEDEVTPERLRELEFDVDAQLAKLDERIAMLVSRLDELDIRIARLIDESG